MTKSDKDTAGVPDERREAWGENYRPRYSGVATFMRQQLCEDEAAWSEIEIGLIGVPFDGGVTNRPGARHGPRQLREQSTLMGSVNHQSGVRPYDLAKVADLGDVYIEGVYNLDKAIAEIESHYDNVAAASNASIARSADARRSVSQVMRKFATDGA